MKIFEQQMKLNIVIPYFLRIPYYSLFFNPYISSLQIKIKGDILFQNKTIRENKGSFETQHEGTMGPSNVYYDTKSRLKLSLNWTKELDVYGKMKWSFRVLCLSVVCKKLRHLRRQSTVNQSYNSPQFVKKSHAQKQWDDNWDRLITDI